MTTQSSSSQKFIEEFYDFPKRPSINDTMTTPDHIMKNSIMKREVDAGLTKREIRRD
jgi:hypothetical protein